MAVNPAKYAKPMALPKAYDFVLNSSRATIGSLPRRS